MRSHMSLGMDRVVGIAGTLYHERMISTKKTQEMIMALQ